MNRAKRATKPSQKAIVAQVVKEPPVKRPRGRPPKNEAHPPPRKAPKRNNRGRAVAKVPEPVDISQSDDEPAEDTFVGTLNQGIADGTLELSESEMVDGDSEYEEFVHPITSTPAVRKKQKVELKGRKAIAPRDVKVQVHDGLALRSVTIATADSLFDTLEKIAGAMKRPNNQVEMGYEAPWSAKTGTRRTLAYISNDEELDDFWTSFATYTSKPKNRKADNSYDIIFRNMMDGNTTTTKPNARGGGSAGNGGGGGNSKPPNAMDDAKENAQAKVATCTMAVGKGMFCHKHGRLCYQKWDGTCGVYTHDHVREHATALANGEPNVVPDKVPPSMTSKLLDYERTRRKTPPNSAIPVLAEHAADNPPTGEAPTPVPAQAQPLNTMPIFPQNAGGVPPYPFAPFTNPFGFPFGFPPTNPFVFPSAAGPFPFPAQAAPPARLPPAVSDVEVSAPKGPLDYPPIYKWLADCERHLERGRDRHEYTRLDAVFAGNGCTRIDDISRMSPDSIRTLATEVGVVVPIGLINRVHDYAIEDVARVKAGEKL
ncbi:hypothetical protein SCHPADRAFT_896835 [Schizopora paradoxa]|uniref:Uncharacterized protein n=1 Tax=Schizopora paradoxa TaxID=27342 RepID=A0A0H2QZ77_9AGAM|nr:hypothetical protein SCHPADRAFT_896835 [Schizopora paradoxa]